jgi:HAD superfamily hydrolase (TIGR01459 family)
MTAPTLAGGLAEIAPRYDVLLCDIWGVIHNGREAFPAAVEALARFKAEYGPVILISNAPRPAGLVFEMLGRLGCGPDSISDIATSGDATRDLLADRAPGPFWKLGPDRDDPIYEGLGLSFAPFDQAATISCTGPYDDDVETAEDYRERFEACLVNGAEMICANPDIVVQRGDKLIPCGGALAQLYEAMGGRVAMAGKPHSAIYDLALRQAADRLGRPVDRAKVLCIGDGMGTDVRGANAQALDVLFIAAGIHGGDIVRDGKVDPAIAEHMLAVEGLHAAWAMADLVW